MQAQERTLFSTTFRLALGLYFEFGTSTGCRFRTFKFALEDSSGTQRLEMINTLQFDCVFCHSDV